MYLYNIPHYIAHYIVKNISLKKVFFAHNMVHLHLFYFREMWRGSEISMKTIYR